MNWSVWADIGFFIYIRQLHIKVKFKRYLTKLPKKGKRIFVELIVVELINQENPFF